MWDFRLASVVVGILSLLHPCWGEDKATEYLTLRLQSKPFAVGASGSVLIAPHVKDGYKVLRRPAPKIEFVAKQNFGFTSA